MPADWVRTPGALNPDVTQATLRSTVCVPGYSKQIRPSASYTGTLKRKQIRDWGLPGGPRAEEVDTFEVDLHEQLCAGRISLHEAQTRESGLKHDKG